MKHIHWPYAAVGGLVIVGILYFSYRDTLYRWYWATREDIAQDIQTLDGIFKGIQDNCTIIRVDAGTHKINFLTVEKFAGSQVGPLNLAYPEKWRGPYLQNNLSVQGVEYQIVHDKQGLFIAPGNGVRLSSGKTVGKDLMLDQNADIAQLIKTELQFNGAPLAVPLIIGKHIKSEYALDDTDVQ